MMVDKLFLDNIDESVNDENRIVTYKWLSQTLQVNCNTAKQMLYEYVQTERKVKNKDGLTVTYFLSGLSTPDDDGVQAFKCAVVPEQKLDSYKSTYAVLTSCHVYSVQKTALKDSNALYMTDYDKFKENVFTSNKYSGIQCSRAKPRSQDDMEMLTLNTVPAVQADKKAPVAPSSAGQKAGQKTMGKSDIQNMFAKKAGKESDASVKKDVKQEDKQETKTTAPKKPAKKGGMDAFFTKQTADKKVPEPKVSPAKKAVEKKFPEKKPSPAKTFGRKTRAHESDEEEEVKPVKKRRRTNQDLFDSDSGEEEMEDEPESPIPPTPPREKTPPPKADSPVVEEEEDTMPSKHPAEESPRGDNKQGVKRRIRRRKQVNKTYMDKEGFMVTEKVWESESASETEEPVQVKKPAPAKPLAKGKKSPKKPSPAKKGSGKQTSLTSFFKKA